MVNKKHIVASVALAALGLSFSFLACAKGTYQQAPKKDAPKHTSAYQEMFKKCGRGGKLDNACVKIVKDKLKNKVR